MNVKSQTHHNVEQENVAKYIMQLCHHISNIKYHNTGYDAETLYDVLLPFIWDKYTTNYNSTKGKLTTFVYKYASGFISNLRRGKQKDHEMKLNNEGFNSLLFFIESKQTVANLIDELDLTNLQRDIIICRLGEYEMQGLMDKYPHLTYYEIKKQIKEIYENNKRILT